MVLEVPDAADALYDLAPDAFVAARDALAKQLRADGDKATAALVAKLRRPTPAAHALNQLARNQTGLLDAALTARAALRTATATATSGAATSGGPGELRQATAADRAATRALVDAAREVLGADPAGLDQKVTATLLAAVVDEEVGAALRAGRLAVEQADAGFGLGLEAFTAAPRAAAAEQLATVTELRPRVNAAARKAAEREAKELEKQLEEAERARRRAESEHRRLVARLEQKAARLAERAAEAEQDAADARAEADAAQAELTAARDSPPPG